jgi:CDP-4-dehydro-6-deoxyglucose reductase
MQIIAGGSSVFAEPGDTILSALKRAEKNIFSICGGRGMCGTCRVAVAADWLERLPPPAFSETRLLRALKAALPNHRLACQTILDADHDGLILTPDTPPTRVPTKEITT